MGDTVFCRLLTTSGLVAPAREGVAKPPIIMIDREELKARK